MVAYYIRRSTCCWATTKERESKFSMHSNNRVFFNFVLKNVYIFPKFHIISFHQNLKLTISTFNAKMTCVKNFSPRTWNVLRVISIQKSLFWSVGFWKTWSHWTVTFQILKICTEFKKFHTRLHGVWRNRTFSPVYFYTL